MFREREGGAVRKTSPIGTHLTQRIGRMRSKVFGFMKTRTLRRIRNLRLNGENRRENIPEDFRFEWKKGRGRIFLQMQLHVKGSHGHGIEKKRRLMKTLQDGRRRGFGRNR